VLVFAGTYRVTKLIMTKAVGMVVAVVDAAGRLDPPDDARLMLRLPARSA
jgi:hypothetical protein